MTSIHCANCNNKIPDKASVCPKCGNPNKLSNIIFLRQITLVLVLFIVALWFYFDRGFDKQNQIEIPPLNQQAELWKIQHHVANDAVTEYEIAKRQGDLRQVCIQAGFICSAYLHANYEIAYRKWKSIEAEDCKKAGLSY
jgi:predicted nucleic acid-binding Zn ribbon protein